MAQLTSTRKNRGFDFCTTALLALCLFATTANAQSSESDRQNQMRQALASLLQSMGANCIIPFENLYRFGQSKFLAVNGTDVRSKTEYENDIGEILALDLEVVYERRPESNRRIQIAAGNSHACAQISPKGIPFIGIELVEQLNLTVDAGHICSKNEAAYGKQQCVPEEIRKQLRGEITSAQILGVSENGVLENLRVGAATLFPSKGIFMRDGSGNIAVHSFHDPFSDRGKDNVNLQNLPASELAIQFGGAKAIEDSKLLEDLAAGDPSAIDSILPEHIQISLRVFVEIIEINKELFWGIKVNWFDPTIYIVTPKRHAPFSGDHLKIDHRYPDLKQRRMLEKFMKPDSSEATK